MPVREGMLKRVTVAGIAAALMMFPLLAARVARDAAPSIAHAQTPMPAAPSAPDPTAAAQAAQQGYAGEDACLTCHSDMTAGYHGTPHGRQADPRAPASNQGCESCHGPGAAHAADPSNEATMLSFVDELTPDQASERCTTCHNTRTQAEWMGSAHESRDLTCVTCHSVHDFKSAESQLKAPTQEGLCATCHRPQTLKVSRTAHMPVPEGKMGCASCHNPHGSANVKLLRAGFSITESCVSCHTAQRGPFLWEHAVAKEDCTTCHDPHGSSNEGMLVAKMPMLCQRCHIHTRHPSTIYDQASLAGGNANRLYARSCVNCHQNIHGSNHPSGVTFLR
jgi:DmsE family decaheme c-type cytochrome